MLTPIYSLFARLPHTRMHKGKVLPLQTPQAFTNRTYRLRRANQIPASKMKNGSATYKTDILKNLAEMGARTTEALPILNPNQIEEARKANKGKFKRNSRYVVKNEGSGGSPPPPRKRKARYAEETDSELEQEKPKAKKPYVGAASAVAGGLTPGQFYENTVENTGFNGGHYFNAPTDAPGPWHGQEQDVYATETTNLGAEESAEDLVPLFDTIGDQGLALLMDSTFTSPSAVIRARRHGHRNTDYVGVHYYTQRTPRYVDENGVIVGDVVHEAFSGQWKASEPTLGHAQSLSSHFDNTGSVGTPLLPRGMQPPNDIPLTPVTGMYAPGHSSYPHTLTQTPTYPQVTRGMGYYAPSQVYPNVPRQNPYYPSVATGMNPYVPDHGVYPDVPGQTPLYPSVTRGMGSYAPSHSFYPNVPGPAPSYPSVTPVTNLQAPLQFQNHLGRFEDEEEAAEEGFGRRRQRR